MDRFRLSRQPVLFCDVSRLKFATGLANAFFAPSHAKTAYLFQGKDLWSNRRPAPTGKGSEIRLNRHAEKRDRKIENLWRITTQVPNATVWRLALEMAGRHQPHLT